MRASGRARAIISALLAIGLWLAIAPASLGGQLSYVITHGNSMEPRFRSGDLAIVHPSSTYDVGEIVAYQSNTLKRLVMHRIVDRDGAAFVFKGDNNNFLDPEHIAKIVAALTAFADAERFAHVVSLDEVKANDFNLNISRYVDTTQPEAVTSVPDALARLREAEKKRDEAAVRMDQLLAELGFGR